jgi:hypothetical protein
VGQSLAPQVGPAGVVASDVSLLPGDLMKGPQSASSESSPANAQSARQQPVQNSLAQ